MKKNFRLLAIDPGIRGMGIAVFEGEKLIYHAVEMLEGNSTQLISRNGRKIIQRLVSDFRPQMIVIEKPYFLNNKHSFLSILAGQVRKVANADDIEFREIAASTIKKYLTSNAHASKEGVCRAVLAEFPELKAYRTRERKWKARYHQNRFDAVAVGMTFFSNAQRLDA